MYGVHVYRADPAKGDQQILLFGKGDFKRDIEGISIYPTAPGKGYILISNQQANTFNVYLRENPSKGKIGMSSPFSSTSLWKFVRSSIPQLNRKSERKNKKIYQKQNVIPNG